MYFLEKYLRLVFFSRSKKMFNLALFKRKPGCQFSGNVNAIDLLNEKRKYLKEEIKVGHSKGHDSIILFFDFEGFYENHRRLLPKNFYFR